MKALKLTVMTIATSMMLMGVAAAKEVKIAYVDLSKVFDNYSKTKDYDAVLQKEAEGYQKEREGMIKKITDGQSKMSLMKEAEKQKLNDEMDKQKRELMQYDQDKRTELAKKRDEKVREILAEIQKIVEGIAQKEGYTYILNDRVLIYGDKTANITDQVLKALNEKK